MRGKSPERRTCKVRGDSQWSSGHLAVLALVASRGSHLHTHCRPDAVLQVQFPNHWSPHLLRNVPERSCNATTPNIKNVNTHRSMTSISIGSDRSSASTGAW